MIHGNIPLYNSYSSLDTSQGKKRNRSRKKKITTQATEKPLPASPSEPFNTRHGAKKPLNQRKSKSIPQTIHQPPRVHQSVQAGAEHKTTHARRFAADDQDETYFSDALSESGSESQYEWFDALPALSEDTSLDAQSTLTLAEDLPESYKVATSNTRQIPTRNKKPETAARGSAAFRGGSSSEASKIKKKSSDKPASSETSTVKGNIAAALRPYQRSSWQNKMLEISQEYFNSEILPHLKDIFKDKDKYDNSFSRFRELVNRPLTDLKATDMTILSKLVFSITHSNITMDYRIAALEFAIQAYTIADSPEALQQCGYRYLNLLRIALAIERGNKKYTNVSHTLHSKQKLLKHHVQKILSSMINLYEEVKKKHSLDYFLTLLIPSHTNYNYRTELFSLMAQLFTLKGLREALAELVETEDTAPINKWELVLRESVQAYRDQP